MAAAALVYPALWTASGQGRTEEVQRLLTEGAAIEERGGPKESSPLNEASLYGREDIVRLLLEHGADLQARDNDGMTSLHLAASMGSQQNVPSESQFCVAAAA
ncbi:ankyrin repeat-containing domain protein [Baffinella frigidus]|nr:ankyrin repeat-containing domain protein [Cryptophyta sp. CCMP2293]|mmetsp:Transcript_64754/g.154622  ORF Transcript_64754/g.154622 Transcript_64754/m.154622 type:complete len:103 (+) Transcript_64754:36-344(+)